MVTLFVLVFVCLCGVTLGLCIAAIAKRRKALELVNNIQKASEGYVLVIGELVTGQVSLSAIVQLSDNNNVVGIIADEVQYYMEEGKTQEEIIQCLYESLIVALEDEHLDYVQPLKKFDFFELLEKGQVKND